MNPLRLPRSIWALGFVSLFMDLSSEIIHALLPIFMVGTLGASAAAVGLIEGLAEGAASIVKVFSGWFSDRLGRRKPLAVAGYGIAALTKPLFALAPALSWVFAARFADRLAKGVRGAPRDALVADLTRPGERGAAYGLRQSLDTIGALIAPLAAVGLMALLAGDVRAVFWIATIPAIVSVVILILAVKEPPRVPVPTADAAPPISLRAALHPAVFGTAFWRVMAVAATMTLARFSEAFLILRGSEMGFGPAFAPLVMAAMSAAYALSAYPAGWLSDRVGRGRMLALGTMLLIAADMIFAFGGTRLAAAAGAVLWGLHMGLTQGLFSAMIADAAPAHLRGSAFGVFHLSSGIVIFAASLIAGGLWDAFGSSAAFLAGAAFAALALVGFAAWGTRSAPGHPAA